MSSEPQLAPRLKPPHQTLGHQFSCPLALKKSLPINDTELSQQGRANGLRRRDHHSPGATKTCGDRCFIGLMGPLGPPHLASAHRLLVPNLSLSLAPCW